MKICTKCGRDLPEDEFWRAPKARNRSGLRSWCKGCSRRAAKEWWDTDGNRRRYHHKTRTNNLRKYGITQAKYDAMLAEQGGVCAICKLPESRENQFGVMSLAVDHDHETGRVRGLLCSYCNRALGGFRDSAALLRTAAEYLEAL